MLKNSYQNLHIYAKDVLRYKLEIETQQERLYKTLRHDNQGYSDIFKLIYNVLLKKLIDNVSRNQSRPQRDESASNIPKE